MFIVETDFGKIIREQLQGVSKKNNIRLGYHYNLLKTTGTTMFQADKKKIVDQLDKYNRQKRKQDNTCTPFLEHLIRQLQKLKGSGSDTDKFVKNSCLQFQS